MQLIETRGNDGQRPSSVDFSQAITDPSASFGGLYVPSQLPDMGTSFLESCTGLSYADLAKKILSAFEVDLDPLTLDHALALYQKFDDPTNPAPLSKIKDDLFICELYHGPTRAFKDMALQPFGHILSQLAKEQEQNYLILAATSGDTGPATLETFANQPSVQVVCLYPDGGTSDVQRLQMVTQEADNLHVVGIHGNFDDAQSALKKLLSDSNFKEELRKKHISLSAANSVNFGRIMFQVIYHVWAYLKLVEKQEIVAGEPIYLIVPSGNFGNALGGYYAKLCGLPVEKILIASNENNILTDWIRTGCYDLRDRSLIKTASPAMDILKSSNVERVLFDLYGSERTRELMENLEKERYYQLSESELERLQQTFGAVCSDDAYGAAAIQNCFQSGYLLDPHTATCLKAYEELRDKPYKSIAYSTAEWTKFAPSVSAALDGKAGIDDKTALDAIAQQSNQTIPPMITELFEKPVKHDTVIDKAQIVQAILERL